MIITDANDLEGLKEAGNAVALTLKKMLAYAEAGMSTKELDNYGGQLLTEFGARSAPNLVYNFPGNACISLNNEICHGIPSEKRIIKEGDLINIDVSAELNGYWSDNGCSIIIGKDLNNMQQLVNTSKNILERAIMKIRAGVKMNELGGYIEMEAKKRGYKVIKNLGGHGIGKNLHEQPDCILNYKEHLDPRRFRKNSVVAIETFINTDSTIAIELQDGFTMIGNKGGFAVQHEHTIVVTDNKPIILTENNGIFDIK